MNCPISAVQTKMTPEAFAPCPTLPLNIRLYPANFRSLLLNIDRNFNRSFFKVF